MMWVLAFFIGWLNGYLSDKERIDNFISKVFK